MGSECIDPYILDLGTNWTWVVSFTLGGTTPRYSLDRRLDGPQNRTGRREEQIILDPTLTRTMYVWGHENCFLSELGKRQSCPYDYLIKYYVMKMYGGVVVEIHVFLTSALVGVEWSGSRTGHFTSGERVPSTYYKGGWVGPRVGLNKLEKRKFLTLQVLELRPPPRLSVRSQSLYRLRYPGSSEVALEV
jgi:hypothetical protein